MTQTHQERGRKGGKTTFERHGNTHMSVIGYGGMFITAERYFAGDVKAMMSRVRQFRHKAHPQA